ncbi:MAG: hypothetical protein AAFR95_08500 [Bacteroidota bacterium]
MPPLSSTYTFLPMLSVIRVLSRGALVLMLAVPASAQMDCFERLRASVEQAYETQDGPGTIPDGETVIEIRDQGKITGYYVAYNNTRNMPSAQFWSPTGEITNCDAQPDECRELLEEAFGGGGGEQTPPADPPANSGSAPQSLPGGAPAYHYEFERARDGSLVYSAERRLRGLWGYRFEPRLCR